MAKRQLVGLFGGTFDPVHIGHLRMALELKRHLGMDEMQLIPCHIPPHRQLPVVDAERRAAMVELAVADCPDLTASRLELNNPAPSYSLHTLQMLREQNGPESALCLAMGMDSLASLDGWYGWEQLLELGHIVVAARPGWQLPTRGAVANTIARHRADAAALREAPAGAIIIEELTLLPISATDIREQIGRGESPQFLLPDKVWDYIVREGLYR
ncbi:MAG: nicotinate-nucleotide adenylyltransferase [Cellvibrionaceae bacterium]